MLLLGIDIGTSSVKVSVLDAQTGKCVGSAHYPETEAEILAPHPGWAEQSPETWWEHTQQAIHKSHAHGRYNPANIGAIGIAYQMHGLVMVDREQRVLRNSIIWCDSRAVETGDRAFGEIGREKCLSHLLNSPGNFTASKLAWVKQHEPPVYEKTDKIMLPGDFIAMKLTGEITTTVPALSEGIFWDFRKQRLSEDLFRYYGLNEAHIPVIRDVFSEHGRLENRVAAALSLKPGIPVTYKAGDQPNNALSLHVFNPGEVAASAGTSGVIYGVSDQLTYDMESRVNSFAHVNHTAEQTRLGVLLCINGTGILNSWVRELTGGTIPYPQMNEAAATVPEGSDGLLLFPFGNGAERMLANRNVYAQINHIDFNKHRPAHLYRAAQEGIACAFRYGLDILRACGMRPALIRAGRAGLFRSDVFTGCFVNLLQVPVELYDSDGSRGAAIGAGLGVKAWASPAEAFANLQPLVRIEPTAPGFYETYYGQWLETLERQLI